MLRTGALRFPKRRTCGIGDRGAIVTGLTYDPRRPSLTTVQSQLGYRIDPGETREAAPQRTAR